ncbi:CGI-121-domain-containing protein [Trichodelitschia bisporula]|uniref:EKC/KEOPS complex subunit CGI121 n=1 Tax=Trichodelitschia bisporula TaxID=703511 RepID=A0A6G1I7X0_9PEZI|nr:CGI-121-domain-containing protein [Trichodelitschia bisporula]
MADGTTLQLPHLASHPVHISLFADVANAPFLRQQLLEGNSAFEYAFLDASTIISVNHVLAAVFRAVNDLLHGRLKSRNVHSEIVFSLSPNNNIAESFRRFGISDTTRTLLAIKVLNSPATDPIPDPSSHLATHVQGQRVPFNDATLALTAEIPRVRKIYKLDSGGDAGGRKGKGGKGQPNGAMAANSTIKEMEAVILGIMAVKGS